MIPTTPHVGAAATGCRSGTPSARQASCGTYAAGGGDRTPARHLPVRPVPGPLLRAPGTDHLPAAGRPGHHGRGC